MSKKHRVECYLQLHAVPHHLFPEKIDRVKVVGVTQNRPSNLKGTHVVKLVMEVDDELVNPETLLVQVALNSSGGKGASIVSQETVWDGT